MLIGRHGQTIDAIQYLANAIVFRGRYDERKPLIVDAAGKPTWAWEAAGQNKALYIVLFVIGIFCGLVGIIAGVIYLASVRPKVLAAGGGPPPTDSY